MFVVDTNVLFHGLAHAIHGSVAERIVQGSPVPVLAVPSGS